MTMTLSGQQGPCCVCFQTAESSVCNSCLLKLVLLYSVAMSLKLRPNRHVVTLNTLAFGPGNPCTFESTSEILKWWSRSKENVMYVREHDHAWVQSFLQEKCSVILSLRNLFVSLMDASSEVRGVEFAGAALSIFKAKVFEAIQHAELVVATRIMCCRE